MYLATHTVDVLTGTAVDGYGDTVDAAAVAAYDVPVSILEQSKRVDRHDTQTPRTVRALAGRAPAGTPISAGDRLRDPATTETWIVDAVTRNANPVINPGLILELRRVP